MSMAHGVQPRHAPFFRGWPKFGRFRFRPKLGRSWADVDRSWADVGRNWAGVGRSWAGFDTILPRLSKSGRCRPNLGLLRTRLGRLASNIDRFGADVGPSLTTLKRGRPKLDRKSSNLDRCRPMLDRFGANLVDIGPKPAKAGPIGFDVGQIRPISAKHGKQWADFDQALPNSTFPLPGRRHDVPPMCTAFDQIEQRRSCIRNHNAPSLGEALAPRVDLGTIKLEPGPSLPRPAPNLAQPGLKLAKPCPSLV